MSMSLRSSTGLRPSRLSWREPIDPMASMANLADVMLVFACGLMMALVSLFGLDLSQTTLTEIDSTDVQEVETPEELPEDVNQAGDAYIERGTLLQDPTTGKYYLKTDEEAAAGLSGEEGENDDEAESSTDSGSTSYAPSPSSTGSSSSSGSSSLAAPDRSAGAD